MERNSPQGPILFFDGVCGLCNGTVDFFIARDKYRLFRYAPLQGALAKQLLEEQDTANVVPRAMVLWEDGQIHRGSTGVLRALRRLPGFSAIAGLALAVPRFLREIVYRFIANHRYQWFGKSESCRLPSPEERELFFD